MIKNLNLVDTLNKKALDSLNKRDFLKAQELFKKNLKENPCHISFNNIGVFYTFEGMQLTNGKTRNASNLGLKYLKIAETQMQSQKNLMAIGDALYGQKDYLAAGDYFKRICAFYPSFISFYNLGLSLYMQMDYLNASIAFEEALKHCNDNDVITDIHISYAYNMVEIDKKRCLKIIHNMIELNNNSFDMDLFILLYLCGDYQTAAKNIDLLFAHYQLDCSVLAMIFDCLFTLKKNEEATECFRSQIKCLEGYDYNIKKEIKCVKQAFDKPEYRKKIIKEYQFNAPIIKGCYYLGCKLHNPM